ncbi:MAG: aryl-sulfate sulfotransferase, partial [Terriglobales bacterium]
MAALLAGCGSSFEAPQMLKPAPQPNSVASVSLSDTSFNFGETLVGSPLQKSVVTVTNTGALPVMLNPALTGDASYSIVTAQSCGTQLAPGAGCAVQVIYAPTVGSAPASQTAVLNLNFSNVATGTPSTVQLTGTSAVMAAGTVTATTNPQVALYTITPPFAGNVTVSFGTTQNYGLQTWSVPTPSGGGPVGIEVAGMLANTAYHLRATVAFQNGVSANDIDHTFTTGNVLAPSIASLPGQKIPQIASTTTPGMTPQGGIEMMNPIVGQPAIVATDMQGNIIWTYDPPDPLNGSQWYAPKQLPDGDFIALASVTSSSVINGPPPANALSVVREFDLIGNTIKQITMDQLNAKLAAANYNITLLTFHHDVTVLPNGHWLVLANTEKSVVLNGATTPTKVLGDVIVDLDTNLNVAWVWNEFDHLDP